MKLLSSTIACAALAVMATAGLASAQPVDPAQAERIRQDRREIEARHQAAVAACASVFAANACLERARTDRREALDRLRHEELVLDDARRKERAARRLEAIESKTSAADARQAVEPPAPRTPKTAAPHSAVRPAAAASGAASAPGVPDAPVPASASTTGRRHRSSLVLVEPEAARAERARQAERRRIEAEQHREKVLERNAARDRARAPAAALPVPSAGAALLPAPAASAASAAIRPAR